MQNVNVSFTRRVNIVHSYQDTNDPHSAESAQAWINYPINRKQRRTAQSRDHYDDGIDLHGKPCTIEEAGLLALKEYKLGHLQAAADIYRLLLIKMPDNTNLHNDYGVILHELKRYDEALASCNKALAIDPHNAKCHYNRANTLQALGRFEEMLSDLDKAISLKPDFAEAYNNRGNVLLELKRIPEAVAGFGKAIALKPDFAEAYNNLGSALQKIKRFSESLVSCDRAIALRPDYAQAWYNRAIALQEMKRYEESLASYDKALALKLDNERIWNNRSVTLRELKRYDDAIAGCAKAMALNPGYASPYQNCGIALVDRGRMAEAEKMFTQALAVKPDFTNPWFSLTNIRTYCDPHHPDIKTIQNTLDTYGDSLKEPDFLYFSLGKIYDDCGLYDQAFECYRKANELWGRDAAYNPAAVTAHVNMIMETFSKDFLAQRFSFSSQDASPVFIIGMPRSGTTLMAGIVSNHPEVATAGELTTLSQFTQHLQPYPQAVRHMAPALAGQLIDAYNKRLRRDAGPDVPYVIDKYPLNFWHVGLIAMLFPKTRIIHCTRHPLDTALSNYFRRFGLDYDYAFDLRAIGHFYKEYARLMEHWHKVLPMNMIDISYEDMIMDTKSVTQEVLDFLGLPWNERCLSPHTNPAPVETASNWQVRQPIYTQAIGRWRHYDKYLGPLKEALGQDFT